jgi:hypothetical protein
MSLFALIPDVPVGFFSRVFEVCIAVYDSVCGTVTMLRPCTELETIMPLYCEWKKMLCTVKWVLLKSSSRSSFLVQYTRLLVSC